MKKDLLTKLAVIFLGLNILFNIAYDLYYAFGFSVSAPDVGSIITWIISIIFTVLLIVGVLTQKKLIFCIYYGFNILFGLCSLIISAVSSLPSDYLPLSILNCFSSITFNIFMLIFILIVFGWKEKAPSVAENSYSVAENKTNASVDTLLEYKQLLDDGAITQEEFDEKKKELLNL